MKRINTARQAVAATQRITANKINAQRTIAPHVLNSTIESHELTAKVSIRRAGRSFNVNGLQVRKGDRVILVASKFAGRYYVCSGGQWSTDDQAVIAKCRAMILQVAA